MPAKKTALPPLAFGNEISIVHENVQIFGEMVDKVFPGLNAYDPIAEGKVFRSKSAVLEMSSSTFVATAISPTYVDRKGNEYLTFIVPVAGDPEAYAQVGSDKVQWGLGRGGVFMPNTDERVLGLGGFRSQIMWQLDKERLKQTAAAMVGQESAPDLGLERVRLLPTQIAGVRVDASLNAVMPLLQLHSQQSQHLTDLGVEDLMYRQSVMLLRPDLFETNIVENSFTSRDSRRRKLILDPLCEYILGHLSEPLTLTQLEFVSGLSARTLQLEFKTHFDCSPMAWIKEQRLLKVRRDLLTMRYASIEGVALAAGFQTMPAFFLAYKKRFGETPGQTRLT